MVSPSFLVFFFVLHCALLLPLLHSTIETWTAPPHWGSSLAVQAALATIIRSTTVNPCSCNHRHSRNPSFGHAASLVWNSASIAWPRRWSSVRRFASCSQTSRASCRRFFEVVVWSERRAPCRRCLPSRNRSPSTTAPCRRGVSYVVCGLTLPLGVDFLGGGFSWKTPLPRLIPASICCCRPLLGCSGLCKCCFTCIWWSEGSNTLTLGKKIHLL